jgi:autotransporter-associated beta strand protein
MKNTIINRTVGVALLSLVFALTPPTQAATRTWNPSGDGNFNNATNWSTTIPGAGDIAQFGSPSVNGPVLTAPITIGAVNFTSTGTGYDLTASNIANALTLMSTATGAGSSAVASQVGSGNTQIDAALVFGAAAAATQQISQVNGGTLILNGPISSTNSITLNYAGGGTITINGANSNTGSSVQTAGSNIIIGNSAAFGTSTLILNSSNGKLTAGINLVGANAIANAVVWNANATLGNSGANGFEFSGTQDLGGAARTINSSASAGVTFDNVISNDAGGGLTIITANGSAVTLKGANTYTGITTISGSGGVSVSSIGLSGAAGNLGENSVIRLGLATSTSPGVLGYTGSGETTDRTIDLGSTTGGATIDTTGATGGLVFSSNFTASGAGAKTLTLQGNSNNNAINGVVVDSSGGATSLVKTGTGSWALGGANTYTGTTTLKNGTLSVGSLGTTGNPGNVGEASVIELGAGNNAVTLNYTGAGETTDHVLDLQGTVGTVTIDTSAGTGPLVITGNVTATGAGSKVLGLNGGNNDNIQGIISDNSATNTTSILKAGGGNWILSGANTYSGGTTIRNGTLSVSSLGNAGNPGNLGTNATITIGNAGQSGTLAYTGAGETTDRVINLGGSAGGATIDTSNSTGPLILTSNFTATGTGSKTLTLKGGNGDVIQGAIVDNSLLNTTALNKTGSGTWNLSGANSYSGGTTVSNGTLRLTGANATLGTGNVSVLSSATNLNITTGVLDAVNDAATLSLAGGGTDGVADNGYAKLGNGVDEVVAALILGGMNEAPGTYGGTGSGAMNIMDEYFSGNGMITVVPEPSIYALIAVGSAVVLGVRGLRRRC